MATYNGERHIAAQLASILQSPQVGEVLVSDDGSSDRTLEIVRSFGDPRVRVLAGPCVGVVRNFECVLDAASGDIIFLADQDDVWLPEKVPAMIEALRDADLVVCDCAVTDGELNVLHPSFFALCDSGPGLWRNLARNSHLGCCIALRRELLTYALPFPDRLPMHDWWLGLVAEMYGRVTFLPVSLMLYRRHGSNASSAAEASRVDWITRIRWRSRLASALLTRRWRHRQPARVTGTRV